MYIDGRQLWGEVRVGTCHPPPGKLNNFFLLYAGTVCSLFSSDGAFFALRWLFCNFFLMGDLFLHGGGSFYCFNEGGGRRENFCVYPCIYIYLSYIYIYIYNIIMILYIYIYIFLWILSHS